VERLGYRNRVLPVIIALKERLPPRSVWPLALDRAATLTDVIFEVLRSKPSLVPSQDTKDMEGIEVTNISQKPKCIDVESSYLSG
jgi:hypothetical protein